MFKITPINDTELQKRYAADCGTEYREGFFGYAMTDAETGALMGMTQFEIDGEFGYIADLRPKVGYSDFEAMFILGRATMNFIDLCGSHKCRAVSDAADERLLRSIGFRPDEDGTYHCDMTGMFDGHCDGHPVKL